MFGGEIATARRADIFVDVRGGDRVRFPLSVEPLEEMLAGQILAMFVLTVAAAEAAIGLAIVVVYFRNRGSIEVEDVTMMKG